MIELILLRHAKTHAAKPDELDHERRLTPRGWDDAPRVARALYSIGARPDLIIHSDAQRCYETLEAIREVFGDVPTHASAQLYLAEANAIWHLASSMAQVSDCHSILVIGHNPGLHELAASLVGMSHDESAISIRSHFPTAAAACFRRDKVSSDWNLHTFLTPKSLRPGDCPDE